MTTLDQLVRVISATPLPRTPEFRLQAALRSCFEDHQIAFEREVRLGDGDIIDFVIDGAIGLEVKVDSSVSEVTRQLHRYAQHESVKQLLLVTTRSKHRAMPIVLNGKAVRVLHLLQGAL